MGWATFWKIFLQTHLVTLKPSLIEGKSPLERLGRYFFEKKTGMTDIRSRQVFA
jgi:hypothetical protein